MRGEQRWGGPDWTTRVVEDLCEMKRAGAEFETAWAVAKHRHRPKARDERYVGLDMAEEADGQLAFRPGQEETVAEAFKRFCRDAWMGEKPILRHFTPAAMVAVDMEPGTRARSRTRGIAA